MIRRMATQDDYTRITLRLPKDLHQKLADSADASSKSMNAEIIARLVESYADEERGVSGSTPLQTVTIASLEEIEKRMQKRMDDHLAWLKHMAEQLNQKKS